VKDSAKILRGVETGTKAGWLVLAGVGLLLLWRFFQPKKREGTVEEVVPILPSVEPATPEDVPEPTNIAPPQGIAAGALVSALRASIIDPSNGGRAYRNALSSNFPATIEVVNVSRTAEDGQIEVVADFYEFTGGERIGVRTRFPVRSFRAGSTERLEVELDSGNLNSLTFEFGQATAVVQVYTNGKLTQSTSFEVW
jgi:hypothetical protein